MSKITFARAAMALVVWPFVIVGLDPVLDRCLTGENIPLGIAWSAGCLGLAWLITGPPAAALRAWRERRRMVPIRRGMQMLHPHWSPAQIEAEVRLYERR